MKHFDSKSIRRLLAATAITALAWPGFAAANDYTSFQVLYETTSGYEALDVEVMDVRETKSDLFDSITARVETSLPASYVFKFTKSTGTNHLAVHMVDAAGFAQRIELDDYQFSVVYDQGPTRHTTAWAQPNGDMMEVLRRNSTKASTTAFEYPFDAYPMHKLTLEVMNELGLPAYNLYAASRTLSNWYSDDVPQQPTSNWAAWEKEIELRATPTGFESVLGTDKLASIDATCEPVFSTTPDGPGDDRDGDNRDGDDPGGETCGEPKACNIPRAAKATAASTTNNVLGVQADLTIAEADISAMCVEGSSLKAESSGGFIQSLATDASKCPAGWDPFSDPDMKEVKFKYEAKAHVFPNTECCHNGPTDTVTGAKATLSFSGQSLEVTGPSVAGDYIEGKAELNADARVCYDEDVSYHDVTAFTLTGTSTATGS